MNEEIVAIIIVWLELGCPKYIPECNTVLNVCSLFIDLHTQNTGVLINSLLYGSKQKEDIHDTIKILHIELLRILLLIKKTSDKRIEKASLRTDFSQVVGGAPW